MRVKDITFNVLTIVQGLCFIAAMILDALPKTHFETIELVVVLSMITSTYILALKELRDYRAICDAPRDKKKKKEGEDER